MFLLLQIDQLSLKVWKHGAGVLRTDRDRFLQKAAGKGRWCVVASKVLDYSWKKAD